MEMKPFLRKPNFYETDAMQIVHHSNYIRWMEEARTDFMEQMGYSYAKATEAGIDLAVVSVSCQYKSMVRFGETVKITMDITKITPARILISYRMEDMDTGTLRCEGESEHCFFSREKGRPIPLKRTLPELYSLFLQEKETKKTSI